MSSSKVMPFYQDIDGFRLPGFFSADAYRSAIAYKPRSDDIFIVHYPKCGGTWMQGIVGAILNKGEPLHSAVEILRPILVISGAPAALTMKRPGAFRMLLPFRLTPYNSEAKYIFIARNPKDVCVSYYHHTKHISGYKYEGGNFDDYFKIFIRGEGDFGDYFDTLLSWYEHRNDPNVLFITYEQLKEDTKKYVLEIAGFIGSEYRTELEQDSDLLAKVIKHSSFSYMNEFLHKHFAELMNIPKEVILNNPDIPEGIKEMLTFSDIPLLKKEASAVNIIRKGIVGDWRYHFSEDQSKRLEAKFRERTEGTDIPKLFEKYM